MTYTVWLAFKVGTKTAFQPIELTRTPPRLLTALNGNWKLDESNQDNFVYWRVCFFVDNRIGF